MVYVINSDPLVASFAEAWIEIILDLFSSDSHCVASFAEAWIEILVYKVYKFLYSRLLRGGVD